MTSKEPRMNTDEHGLKYEELTGKIIKVFYDVYNELGHGFLESVYKKAMIIALRAAGLQAEPDAPIQVHFRGHSVGDFEADMFVESLVLLELKACRNLDPSHEAQTLNYLRATTMKSAFFSTSVPSLKSNGSSSTTNASARAAPPTVSDLC
jgi:GxxExxY protein